jgi:hypothetical protein
MHMCIQARIPGTGSPWQLIAIDSLLMDVVKAAPGGETSLICDEDDVPMWEVDMPFHQLLARLNDDYEPLPIPGNEPVEVVAWAVAHVRTGKVDALYLDEEQEDAHNCCCSRGNYIVVRLTGSTKQ